MFRGLNINKRLYVILFIILIFLINGCNEKKLNEIENISEDNKEIKDITKESIITQSETQTKSSLIENRIIVTNVIDGDTIDLNTGERVRLIGINSAEKGKKCYQEAKDYLTQLIENKEITLENDITDKDIYERLLKYVFINEINVNIEMVKRGYANVYIVNPNNKYESELKNAENTAKLNNGCLWETSLSNCKDCIKLIKLEYDAEGNDCYNLNEEYAIFKNVCSYSCDLSKWSIKDNTASHLYIFSSFILDSNSQFTLYTGRGSNTKEKLYWGGGGGSCGAIWNNDGDTLYLRDNNGDLVLSYGY